MNGERRNGNCVKEEVEVEIHFWQLSLSLKTLEKSTLCLSQDQSVTDADEFERKWEEVKSN